MSIFSQRFRICGKAGFTLIELMVAVSIVVFITIVLLFRHDQFNSSTLLRSLSYSVALSIRQAQLYGTSVRETGEQTGLFAQSYGVYFKDGNPNEYYLAADKDDDGTISTQSCPEPYTASGCEDVSPSPYSIQTGYGISDFCAYTSVVTHCHSGGAIDELTVRFDRPNPDAVFVTDQGSAYIRGCVEVASPGGATRTIEITNTGQITVGQAGETCNGL
jgi:prepilin-type N-terminal cleavage/methylation domain-containing protein